MTRRSSQRDGSLPSAGFPGTGTSLGRIYGLGLLLLLLVFFLLTFRGRTPRVLERVFETPQGLDEATLAARREVVRSTQNGAFVDATDSDDFRETPGYRRLLQSLIDHVRPGDVVASPPLFDRDLALEYPDVQRTEIVKVRGYVAQQWAQKLDQPVFQLTDVWRVFLADHEGENGMVVDLVARPPVLEERRDQIELVGRFYRLVKYETKRGQFVTVPYLLARELAVLPEAPRPGPALDDPATVALVLGVGSMLAWGVYRFVSTQRRKPVVRWRAPYLHSRSADTGSNR